MVKSYTSPDGDLTPVVLTIAGSDSSGGAGLQTDLKTFQSFGCFGMSVVTAVTAQNSCSLSDVHIVPLTTVEAQLQALFEDYDIKAVKIGMVGSIDHCAFLGAYLKAQTQVPIVVDTPLSASVGGALGKDDLFDGLKEHLFPIASLITPNAEEAALFLNEPLVATDEEMLEQALRLSKLVSSDLYLKGGHVVAVGEGVKDEVKDVLIEKGKVHWFSGPYVDVLHTHGTGCALSSAITALLAQGVSVFHACAEAKKWMTRCLHHSQNMGFGAGPGPLNTTILPHFDD